MNRHLEAQFDARVVSWIRKLTKRFSEIRYASGPSRYYSLELIACLESGALLGSLVIASALLELHVRALVIYYATRTDTRLKPKVNFETKLENMKKVGFAKLLTELADANLFDREDARRAQKLYEEIRIPLLHGLPSRFISHHSGVVQNDLLLSLGFDWNDLLPDSTPVSARDLEDTVEKYALKTLRTIVKIIERSALK